MKNAVREKAEKTSNCTVAEASKLAAKALKAHPMPKQTKKKPGTKISAINSNKAATAHQSHWKNPIARFGWPDVRRALRPRIGGITA